jgi:hypothetical protein
MDVHALPSPDGSTHQYSLDRGSSYVPKKLMTFRERVKALALFQDRFSFFTIAPAYLWGGLRDCVLADFRASQAGVVDFYHMKFDHPVFAGLEAPNGDVAWNHVLWAVENSYWQPLVDHLCSAVLTDRPRQVVYRFGIQPLEIFDPLVNDRAIIVPAVPPFLAIGAFGVRSNAFTAAFVPAANPLVNLPQAGFYAADEQCTLYARALFKTGPVCAALSHEENHDRQP